MTEREEIQTAYTRLSQLKEDSGAYRAILNSDFQSVKYLDGDHAVLGTVSVDLWDGSEQFGVGDWRDSSAISLIVALHQSTDPLLSVLQTALDGSWGGTRVWLDALALARSINM